MSRLGALDVLATRPNRPASLHRAVSLYIHPNPVPSDEWKVLRGYPGLEHATWSWNHRNGGHALRLIFGGVFDRFPGARIILGHMGEFLPAQLFRIDARYQDLDPQHQQQLKKLPSEYFGTNIAITTSGVFSHSALMEAIQTIGVDSVMFSIGYPFESSEKAVEFMRTAPLAPADKARVAHGNAERILRSTTRFGPAAICSAQVGGAGSSVVHP